VSPAFILCYYKRITLFQVPIAFVCLFQLNSEKGTAREHGITCAQPKHCTEHEFFNIRRVLWIFGTYVNIPLIRNTDDV
jgi:hypothetical protein